MLAAMAMPLFALSMDVNGAGTVLPSIQDEYGVSGDVIGWVINSIALTFAATLIAVGRLAPRVGNKRMVLTGVTLFGISSLITGVAPTFPVLIAARVGQGLGGVLMFTSSLAVIDAVFDERRRAAAIGAWGMVNGIGGAIGPLVAGAVTTWSSWRTFFLLNVPLCLIALPIMAVLTPSDRRDTTIEPLPIGKFVALGVALVAITIGFQNSATYGWFSPQTLGVVGAGALVLALLGTSHSSSLVTRAVTSGPYFRSASIAAFSANWGFGVTIVVMGLYLQTVRGLTPLAAGLLFSTFSIMCGVAGVAISTMSRRLGIGRSVSVTMTLLALSLGAGALLTASTPLAIVAFGLGVIGFGEGLAFDFTTLASLHDVPESAAGEASGVVQTVRSMGLTIGIAVSATVSLTVAGGTTPEDLTRGAAAALALAGLVAFVGLVGAWFVRPARTVSAPP